MVAADKSVGIVVAIDCSFSQDSLEDSQSVCMTHVRPYPNPPSHDHATDMIINALPRSTPTHL